MNDNSQLHATSNGKWIDELPLPHIPLVHFWDTVSSIAAFWISQTQLSTAGSNGGKSHSQFKRGKQHEVKGCHFYHCRMWHSMQAFFITCITIITNSFYGRNVALCWATL